MRFICWLRGHRLFRPLGWRGPDAGYCARCGITLKKSATCDPAWGQVVGALSKDKEQ